MRQIAGVFFQLEKTRLVKKLKAARDRRRATGARVEGRRSCLSDQSRCKETANEGFAIRVVNETYVCAIIRRQPRHSSRGDQNPTLANNDNQTASCICIDRVCRSTVLPRATLLRVPRMSRDGRCNTQGES